MAHLDKTIRMIVRNPGVEGLHRLARSRGSAVLISASRDLVSEAIAFGVEPPAHRVPGLVWDFGQTLACQAIRTRAGAVWRVHDTHWFRRAATDGRAICHV